MNKSHIHIFYVRVKVLKEEMIAANFCLAFWLAFHLYALSMQIIDTVIWLEEEGSKKNKN